MKSFKFISCVGLLLLSVSFSSAQEKIFAGYFDIPVNSPKGTEVTGRIHLERNKDVLTSPIPADYHFVITSQDGNLFRLDTRRDPVGRIMGVLSVDKGNTGKQQKDYKLTIELRDGKKLLNTFPITVKIVDKTLWSILYERYKDYALTGANGRMYGRLKPSDAEVAASIAELENNGGRFKGFRSYTAHPEDYRAESSRDPWNNNIQGTIEFDWEKICNRIGGLGWAYASSKKYGPGGDPAAREQLKRALYSAIIAYANSVPVEGSDVIIDGKPIGLYTGDGFSNLLQYNLISIQDPTHQWEISDGLLVPAMYLTPEIVQGMAKGDKQAEQVYYALVRFLQVNMPEIESRRAIDNPNERWGNISDTLRSSGAWADANLGHRSRFMLALPIIWADYNRPQTYVQYWYSDYYKDKPFPGFSYSPGWSPHGVVFDNGWWLTKYIVPSHKYAQSGFHPDGTVSHHIGEGTDASMVAYGFEWLTACFVGFNQYKNTDFRVADKYYQFPADRLEKVYPRLIYKGSFDHLVAGRSFLADMKKFGSKTYPQAITELKEAMSTTTKLTNLQELDRIATAIKKGTWEYSGTDAYWVNEFLVHRRGENEKPFYASVKLKSERTVGAEDFDRVRHSWHMGNGILELRVTGDEFSSNTLGNFDWHALPGLTEEWRTDPMPAKGGAAAAGAGDNKIAGVTADGKAGLAIYHHLPRETYSSATGYKSYFFIEDKIASMGTNIKRLRPGQGKEIMTFVDQGAFTDNLTICCDGKTQVVRSGESVDLVFNPSAACWLHTGSKGYIIYPVAEQKLIVKTGKNINVTDPKISDGTPIFIIAISHGVNPQNAGYCYFLVPNATSPQMETIIKDYANVERVAHPDVHGIYSPADKTWEAGFFAPGKITLGGITIESEDVALVLLRDTGKEWKLTVSNPAPDKDKQQLKVHFSIPLKAGKYDYQMGGIYPRPGEYVTVTNQGNGSLVVAELADSRDGALYSYQEELYNAAPITINIPK